MSDTPALALLAGTPPPPPPPPSPPPPSAAVPVEPEGGSGRKPARPPARRALAPRALHGDVLEPDLLTTTAHEIENLCAERAHALVAELGETSDYNAFKLGGVLARIHSERWYEDHGDFKTYVQDVHGFSVSKAFYLVNIYKSVVELGLAWKDLKPVGWSKLKELAAIITKDNAAEWLARAAAPDMTVLRLHALVKAARDGDGGSGQGLLGGGAGAASHKLAFKLHDDQAEIVKAAIDKAKGVSGTAHDSAAIEYIAQDFLANAEKMKAAGAALGPARAIEPAQAEPAQAEIIQHLRKIGLEAALALVDLAFPDANISVEIDPPAGP